MAPDSGQLSLRVLRCQAGDQGAFGDLYREFSARTLRYLRGILGDAHADDVQQDVWLTVYRRIADVANPAGFRTWLYQVARHRAIDCLRREQRRSEIVSATGDDLDRLVVDDARSDTTVDRDTVAPLLGRLSAPHREVLLLRFWDELSYGDIAVVVGCTVGTVRSRLHHAKLRIGTLLEEDGPPGRKGRTV